jgi:hypothetical protein
MDQDCLHCDAFRCGSDGYDGGGGRNPVSMK